MVSRRTRDNCDYHVFDWQNSSEQLDGNARLHANSSWHACMLRVALAQVQLTRFSTDTLPPSRKHHKCIVCLGTGDRAEQPVLT